MPGALDQGTDGQPLAEQPVQPGDVGPQVAAHEDDAHTGRERSLEVFVPEDFKTLEDRPVQVESVADLHQAIPQPRSSPRPEQREDLPQPAQNRVGPARAQGPEQGQEKLVERELPAEDPAQEPIHVRGPYFWSAAMAPSRW